MQRPRHPKTIGGRPKVFRAMAYFPALIPKSLIETQVDIVEA